PGPADDGDDGRGHGRERGDHAGGGQGERDRDPGCLQSLLPDVCGGGRFEQVEHVRVVLPLADRRVRWGHGRGILVPNSLRHSSTAARSCPSSSRSTAASAIACALRSAAAAASFSAGLMLELTSGPIPAGSGQGSWMRSAAVARNNTISSWYRPNFGLTMLIAMTSSRNEGD